MRSWDLSDPLAVNRLGTLARFSSLLADYESVRRRARPDPDFPGEQVGGQDRGTWYYRNLGLHIINYAQGAYEGFDGEADFELDAVDLTTVHRAKGLEWPAVFVPSVTAGRFPSRRTGEAQDWLVPRDRFHAARYEGSDGDERRLFYVALTRARDWVSISRHERVTKQRVGPSPYHSELTEHHCEPEDIVPPAIGREDEAELDPISLSYSELAAFIECGTAFRLRDLIGFQPRLAPELGYGKAVHHVHAHRGGGDEGNRRGADAERDRRDPRRELLPADGEQARASPAQGGRAPAGHELRARSTKRTSTGCGRPSVRSSSTSTASRCPGART